jgi:hypothetical protein
MAAFRISGKYSTARVVPVDLFNNHVHPGLRNEYLWQEFGLLTRLSHGDPVLQVQLTEIGLG